MRIALFANETTLPAHLARFGAEGLAAVVLSPGRPAVPAAALAFRARHPDIPLLDYPDPPDAEDLALFAGVLGAFDLDLIVVHAFARILPRAIFARARRGAVNLHGGPLPEMRGANVVNWAVALGMERTAVTLHRVVERVDAGPVVDAAPVPIRPEDDARSLRDRLVAEGCALLARHLPDLLAGRERAAPQDEARAVRFRRRTDADGRIDWNLPATRIHDLVRALVPPWPGAHFDHEGRCVRIRRSRVLPGDGGGVPGRMRPAPDGTVAVDCGEGRLALLAWEVEGGPAFTGGPRMRSGAEAVAVARDDRSPVARGGAGTGAAGREACACVL